MWIPAASLGAPALFLAGAASGVHCGLMCGAIGIHHARAAGGLPAASALAWVQAGRILGYTLLGALAGALGQSVLLHLPSPRAGQYLQALAALGLAGAGLRLLLRSGAPPACCMPPAPPQRCRWPLRPGLLGRGLLWALLPCGLLYSLLLLAALSGSAGSGALLSGAFAAGGAPLLAGIGWSGRRHGAIPPRRAGWWLIATGLAGCAASLLFPAAIAGWCAARETA
jgi:sulfite exporter TauE/SafE